MLVVLTEMYCNKVNIQITQRDDFIQTNKMIWTKSSRCVLILYIHFIIYIYIHIYIYIYSSQHNYIIEA